MELQHLSNSNLKLYKTKLISMGFRHKSAKKMLKYIIKNNNILLEHSINIASLQYWYGMLFHYKRSYPIRIIIAEWVNTTKCEHYWYLVRKLRSFEYNILPLSDFSVNINPDYITKMLYIYYHEKEIEPEKDDILIFKEFIDEHLYIFIDEEHANFFLEQIKDLFRIINNWKIFVTKSSKYRYNLPIELFENVRNYYFNNWKN